MVKLKNKILKTIGNNKDVENTLNELSVYQNNIIKNYNNPVFSNEDKNKLLNFYSNIEDLGKSLYRYNILKQNNITKEAEIEKGNIENLLLKGYISNKKYVWHSEMGEHTCEVCADLDGQEFDSYEEVPQRPHSNCKCTVEIVESASAKGGDYKPSEDDEPCDCWDKIGEIYNQANQYEEEIHLVISNIEKMRDEVINWYQDLQNKISIVQKLKKQILAEKGIFIKFDFDISSDEDLLEKVKEIVSNSETALETLEIFDKNKKEMEADVEHIHIDKYYHAKANCESVELGSIQALWAALWSGGKEVKDIYKKIKIDHQNVFKVIMDSLQDLKTDLLGFLEGFDNGYCADNVGKVEKEVFGHY